MNCYARSLYVNRGRVNVCVCVCVQQILLAIEQRLSLQIRHQYQISAANATYGSSEQLTTAWDRVHSVV